MTCTYISIHDDLDFGGVDFLFYGVIFTGITFANVRGLKNGTHPLRGMSVHNGIRIQNKLGNDNIRSLSSKEK